MKKKVLFVSSTGGHLNELLQLDELFKKYDYYIVTENTKSNLYLKDKYKNRISYLIYGTKKHPITYFFKLIINSFTSWCLTVYWSVLFADPDLDPALSEGRRPSSGLCPYHPCS